MTGVMKLKGGNARISTSTVNKCTGTRRAAPSLQRRGCPCCSSGQFSVVMLPTHACGATHVAAQMSPSSRDGAAASTPRCQDGAATPVRNGLTCVCVLELLLVLPFVHCNEKQREFVSSEFRQYDV